MNHFVTALSMINQEDGAMPGTPASLAENIAVFAGIPIALFLVIGGIAYALTGDKKSSESRKTLID